MSKDIKLEISVSEDIGGEVKIMVRHIYNGELKILTQVLTKEEGVDALQQAQLVADFIAVKSSLLLQESLDSALSELIGKKP